MKIEFTQSALKDYNYWEQNDSAKIDKVKSLIISIKESPFSGIGKPEALRHSLKGYWSRRITREHSLVYKISGEKGKDQKCTIIMCRHHYDE